MTIQVASISYLKTLTAMAFLLPKLIKKYICVLYSLWSVLSNSSEKNSFSVPKKEKIRHIKRLILYSVFKLRKGYGLRLTSLFSSF